MEYCAFAMYTDSTGLYFRGASLAQLNETNNKDLGSLGHCLKGNKLSVNAVKTISMKGPSAL